MKEIIFNWLLPFLPLIITFIVSYFGIKGEDKSLKIWKAVAMTLIVGIFMATTKIMFTVDGIGEVANKFVDPQKIIKVFDEAYECHPGLGDICRKKFSKSQKSFQDMLLDAQNKEYKIDKNDIGTIALSLIDYANKSIYATSYVNEEEWWRKEWGKTYLDANKKAIERGVKIERTFIFPDEKSFERSRDILENNCKVGVLVKYLYKDVFEDIIIVDDKFAGLLALDARNMDGITLSNRQDFMEKANTSFRIASSGAEIFDGCEKK